MTDILSRDQGKLESMKIKLKMDPLNASDWVLLSEFVAVMRPCSSIRKNTFLGCVLPTILKINKELSQLTVPKIQQ